MIRPLVAVAAAALLVSCGSEEIEPMPTVDGVPAAVEPGFSIRPALSDPEGTACDADLALDEPGKLCDSAGLAIEVGPAAVVDGVVSARAVELREGAWGLQVELDPASASALEELARSASSSQSRIAIVIGGEVVSAPTVAGVIGAGSLQIAGDWSQQVAEDLAAQASGADGQAGT